MGEDAAGATDGSQVRFASTADVVAVFEGVSGQDLDWLFEAYLREAELPTLRAVLVGVSGSRDLSLRWETPGGAFPRPVDVYVDGERQRVEFQGTKASVRVPRDADVRVDPADWILREPYGDPLLWETLDE